MLHLYLHSLIPALVQELSSGDDEAEIALRECLRSLLKSAHNAHALIQEIASRCDDDDTSWKLESCWMIGILVEERKSDFSVFKNFCMKIINTSLILCAFVCVFR